MLSLTLNGRARTDAVPDNVLLLDYLREIVGLTGTKTGCDGGECGACTVLVDDSPRLSCLTLAATVAGRRVDTIESLAIDGRLSAVQRGFHEKLGSQCGYCTPGFIMASAGLVAPQPAPERRRDSRGARQQHLPLHRLRQNHRGGEARGGALRRRSIAVIGRCRSLLPSPCGEGMGVGVARRCASVNAANVLHHPPPRPSPTRGEGAVRASLVMNEIVPAHNIGDYVPMIDGPEKVSGRAKYTADLIVPGTLAGRIFRSPYSHAEILDVDVSEAAKLPGVKAIVTGADCDKTFGVLPIARTEHPLARERVRYRGEPVAAVAAVDDATAKEALRRIKLKVRELPAYHTATRGDGAGRHRHSRPSPAQHRARCLLRTGRCRGGLCGCRSGARRHLQLRRSVPEPDGDARRARRLRCGARPHDRACFDAGALLRAPDAVANPRHGHVAHPRDQTACRRRLRLPHRDAQCRADRRLARPQGRRLRTPRGQPRGDLHHPSRPARKPTFA